VPPGLTEALRDLRERWWILALAAVLAAGAAYAYTQMPWVEPRYRSSIFIQATGRMDYGNTLALERELRPLAEQVLQRTIMRQVNQNLNLDLPVDRILQRTKAEPVQDSSQIRVDVEDPDPRRAEQVALEIADVYVQTHNAAEQAHVREERVILFPLDRSNPAVLTYPQKRLIVPVAGLLGLLAAAGVVGVASLTNDSLNYPSETEEALGLPVLGAIPRPRQRTRTLAWARRRARAPARPAAGLGLGHEPAPEPEPTRPHEPAGVQPTGTVSS